LIAGRPSPRGPAVPTGGGVRSAAFTPLHRRLAESTAHKSSAPFGENIEAVPRAGPRSARPATASL